MSWLVRTGQVLFALLLLLGAALPAHAGAARLEESCRIAADPGLPLAEALRRLDRCEGPAAHGYAGTVWIDYRDLPLALEALKTYRIAIDNHRVEAIDLWLIGNGKPVQHLAYDPNAPDREWLAGDYFSMLVGGQTPAQRIVLRLSASQTATLVRAPKLARAKDFAPIERNQAALYGVGVGMLALAILFHLSLFFAIRRRFQLIYCAHMLLLLAYAVCYSGIVRIVMPMLGATDTSRLLGFSMVAATATGIAFIVEFLGPATPRALRRWASAGILASAAAAIALAIAPAAWTHPIYVIANYAVIHAIVVTACILIAACWRRQPMAWALSAAWTLPIAISLMYPARTLGLIGDDMLPDGLMMFAATVECVLLSFPVASRIRDLRLEHERAHERHLILERQAQTDSLTGLANRRGFGDALARAAIAHEEPLPLALLIIDIDHFKRVNDRYGHAAGDEILRHVAAHVAKVAGPGAIVARHGGEEFVVALKGYDLPRAGTIAERIRNSIGVTFGTDIDLPRVTISIGVAAGSSDELETLLADADCALYRAKNEGRDRVMLADGPLMYAAAA